MARVLIVGSLAASLRNFRGALIEELRKLNHEVHAAAPGLSDDVETRSWLQCRGVVCHDVAMSRTGRRPIEDVITLIILCRLLRGVRPNVFIGYTIKPVVWGLIASKLLGVKQRIALITGLGYAFTESGNLTRRATQYLACTLYKIALHFSTLIFFQNPDDRNDFQALDLIPSGVPVKIVSGSGVDTNHFTPQPFPSGHIRFLLIARLLGNKGIREYVSSARYLRRRWPQSEFHIVGGVDPSPDGIPEYEISQWRENGDVFFHGHLDDVRPAISNAHVYVLPSYREGTPRTVLEAMSMGRPIVTTDSPGCRQTVVPGRNGFLVRPRDCDSLTSAMEEFLKDRTLVSRMGDCSRSMVEKHFDVGIVNAAMILAMDLN